MNDLTTLALTFLRISILAFGGSTAILPELQRVVVDQHGWLTHQQFLDGFALGALTPGPALLMVMFIGFRVAGIAGAFVALAAIMLPSSLLAALATGQWAALRTSPWLRGLQRGVGAVALGLTAAGAFSISRLALTDATTIGIGVVAFLLLWRLRINAAIIVPAGGVAGALLYITLGAR